MKKSLIALAALTAFAGAASAQSSVTLYGRVDLSAAKPFGTDAKQIGNGSGSRVGLRGVEDLGGGISALFQIEHRFNADTGALSDPSRFWGGRSIVGFKGSFGQVVLGREYTPAFLQSQLAADPWGWDTANSTATAAVTGGSIAKVRNDSSITYTLGIGGFKIGAQVAEATDTINKFPERPMGGAISYAGGPITFGLGYERTGEEGNTGDKEEWATVNLAWNFGFMKLGGFYGTGTRVDAANPVGTDVESYMITATAPIGAGELRLAFGQRDTDDNTDIEGYLIGYHYSLSKRTTVYADYGYNKEQASGSKSGYDIGVKHNF